MSQVKDKTFAERARTTLRKVAFESLYNQFAWSYDWVSRTFFLGQWRVWQRAAIPHLRGSRVLEVGMGTGDLQIDLRKAGYEAWGIDLSPQMLRRAAAKARKRHLQPFRVCRARAQALPFPPAYFDSLLSTFPSDYIALPATLRELARVLEPGGRLVIVPGGHLLPKGYRGKVLESLAGLVYGSDKVEKRAASPEAYLRRHLERPGWTAALEQCMAEAGFSVTTHIASNNRGAALVIVANKGE